MGERSVSARYALTNREFEFCRKKLAGLSAADSYRRAYLVEASDGEWYTTLRLDGTGEGEPLKAATVSKRASAILALEHIQNYLDELKTPAADLARGVLLGQAVFENSARAAETVLEQDDKLGARDAYEHWAMIMCAIGTEVVIDVGGSEVVVPMKALFPQFAEALPPPDVVVKTIKSLEAFLERDNLRTEKVPDA